MATRSFLLPSAALLFLTTTSIAIAQPTTTAEAELATARALFEEGLAREDVKDWAGALERFRRVAEIRLTPQVIYNIALCLDHLNKLASADRQYLRVEKVAEGSTEPAVRELARLATARRATLHASIPEITFEASPPVSDTSSLKVTLDGSPLAPSTWKTPLAIDPGSHELVVVRHGGEARRTFTVEAGARSVVAIPIPAEPHSSSQASAEEEDRGSHVPIGAWFTGGIAVAGIGVGIFAVVSKTSAMDDLDAVCGPNRDACPESKRGEADRVSTMTTVANVSFGVAIAAAIATGAIVYFAWKPAPQSRQAASKSSSSFSIWPTTQGLALSGRF